MEARSNSVPFFTGINTFNASGRYGKHVREFAYRLFLCVLVFENISYLFFGKLASSVVFSVNWIASSLYLLINHVVFGRSNEKMIGPNANGIVAFMANKHSLWNFSNVEAIGKAMRLVRFIIVLNPSVSANKTAAGPLPAPGGFFNFLPKLFFQRVNFSHQRGVSYAT